MSKRFIHAVCQLAEMAVELFSVVLSVVIHQVSVMCMSLSQKDNCGADVPTVGVGSVGTNMSSSTAAVDVIGEELLGTWKKSYFLAASVITAIIVITMLVFVFGNDETTS